MSAPDESAHSAKSFKNRPSWRISCCSSPVLDWLCGLGDGGVQGGGRGVGQRVWNVDGRWNWRGIVGRQWHSLSLDAAKSCWETFSLTDRVCQRCFHFSFSTDNVLFPSRGHLCLFFSWNISKASNADKNRIQIKTGKELSITKCHGVNEKKERCFEVHVKPLRPAVKV